MTKKYVENNVRWFIITTPHLNSCLFSSNKRKEILNSAYFSEKTYIFEAVAQIIIISSYFQTWLNWPLSCKRDRLRENGPYFQTLLQDTCRYLLKAVALVTTFSQSNVPYYEFETILNKHSRSHYLHIFLGLSRL